MSTQNPNNVVAELVLAITQAPSFAVVHSRGVDVSSIQRSGVGSYDFRTIEAVPLAGRHIEVHGYGVGKPGNPAATFSPRHVFVRGDEEPEESNEWLLRCYSLDDPPVLDENDCVIRILIHSSPESAPVATQPAP